MIDHERGRFELDAEAMRALFAELNERLLARGIAASVYVVGGAAMALAYGRDGLTPDIDAVASHSAVLEEARAIAGGHGLAEQWLNSGPEAWIPPRPESALGRPTKPGLTVHIAPPEHVLAMKLVALRRKDRPDIRLLIERLGMAEATPEDYADLLERIYSGDGRLATALTIPGDDEQATRSEALAMAVGPTTSPPHYATASSSSPTTRIQILFIIMMLILIIVVWQARNAQRQSRCLAGGVAIHGWGYSAVAVGCRHDLGRSPAPAQRRKLSAPGGVRHLPAEG